MNDEETKNISTDDNFKLKRLQMVKEQLIARGIQDEAVLQAMFDVPRHHFVHSHFKELAYEDTPLPIQGKQTISQPYIVARMTELLQLQSDDRVLDVGTGSAYAAAVMSRIAKEVYSIERHTPLVHRAVEKLTALDYDNVTVSQGDGSLGWPEYAPYDAIMVAAGGPEIPSPLLEQLAVNGRLVIPIGTHPRTQILKRVRRLADNNYETEDFGGVRFVPLVGEAGWDGKKSPETAQT